MDEEDLADAEDAKQLQTTNDYAGLGSTGDEDSRSYALVDIMRLNSQDSMGIRLLQKMGWRPGQGVGPKVLRKARADTEVEDEDLDIGGEKHLFAPENTKIIDFVKKNDFKGLGYSGEASLDPSGAEDKPERDDADNDSEAAWSRSRVKKPKPKTKKPSFGVGVLNDNGSDDDDPYDMGPKISYNRTIGGDKKPKKKPVGGANPLLVSRPIFTSKKAAPSRSQTGFRRCHDGRLPVDGFILSVQTLEISPINKYPPPKIPDGWQSRLVSADDVSTMSEWQSTTDAAKTSTLDPKDRASLLGEEMLPGKSIFDYISPTARNKLAAASGRTDLPQGLGEEAPESYRLSEEGKRKQLWDAVPPLSKVVALEALQRAIGGWMPYAEDDQKRSRYRAFLELKAGMRNNLPEHAEGLTMDDWKHEMSEFAQAAEVFRPMTGAMASRFTSSSRTYEGSNNSPDGEDDGSGMPLLTQPVAKSADPAEEAAKIGMYGPMTRSVLPFHPTRLVCKRFNVRPPSNVDIDPGANVDNSTISSGSAISDLVPKKAIERMMQDAALRRFTSSGVEGALDTQKPQDLPVADVPKRAVVDADRNEALEVERPGDAVFKAIFGSDDEVD